MRLALSCSKAASERAAELCLAEIDSQLEDLRSKRQELSLAAAKARDDVPVRPDTRGKCVSVSPL